jgi:peroxiredoxin
MNNFAFQETLEPVRQKSLFPDIILTHRNEAGEPEYFSILGELQGRRVAIITAQEWNIKSCSEKHLCGFKELTSKFPALGIRDIIYIVPNESKLDKDWTNLQRTVNVKICTFTNTQEIVKMGLGRKEEGRQDLVMENTCIIVKNCQVEWIENRARTGSCGMFHNENVASFLSFL